MTVGTRVGASGLRSSAIDGSPTAPGRSAEPARAVAAALSFASVVLFAGCVPPPAHSAEDPSRELVGPAEGNRFVLPVSQVVTPAGRQVELPGLRPQALALSPDGRLLAVSGKAPVLVLVDPATGDVLQRVPLPSEKAAEPDPKVVSPQILEPDTKAQVSFTGLVFSPDGSRIYLSNVNGSIKVFAVDAKGEARGIRSIPLPSANAPGRREEIPSGLALSSDAKILYVALNLSNRLGELDLSTGTMLRTFDVGVAPYDVAIAGRKAWVSNWGGRRPDADSVTGPAGRGTRVRVDPVRHIACEGTVSVVDLAEGKTTREIPVGLHASALALTPDRRHLVVANAASDTLSIVDTATDEIVETLSLRPPVGYFGASPNALAFDERGETLFVCNGTHNAVAVVALRAGRSRVLGLIPVGWFPGAIAHDARRNAIHVANLKGIGSGKHAGAIARAAAAEAAAAAEDPADDGAAETADGEEAAGAERPAARTKHNSHEHFGTLSLIPLPGAADLEALTRKVLENRRREAEVAATLPARNGVPPRPVPERSGEPSVFKHVVYIIKENRTYDQVLGDLPQGRGDPSLCIFGEEATPNQHAMVRQFVLLDNAYCSGVLSADGHQWATTAFATDYMEKSFAGFPRSYPDGMGDDEVDALAYSPEGFLWDNAVAHGKTFRDYGEFAIGEVSWTDPARKGAPTFLDHYRDFLDGTGRIKISSRPAIESLRPYLAADTIGWDMDVPDVLRADRFLKDLRRFEEAGELPQLIIICLPNDHTSGTKAGSPTPAAQVADNDLAFGRIVEGISKSRFWKDTCILAIEDDPQDGWDHVSAYRTTAYVVSPYTRRGAVVSTQYNQPGLLRTIELILGLPPMNVMDATATPLFDCFTDTPDFTPFTAVPNRVPLDAMNPSPHSILDPVLKEHALASASLPLDDVDRCPEGVLNRILWHAVKGSGEPYPAWATREGRGARGSP